MKYKYITFFIINIAYLMFLVGGLFLFRKQIKIIQLRFLLRHRLKLMRRKTRELPSFYRYIRSILFVGFKNPPNEMVFLIVLSTLFLFTFARGVRYFSVLTALCIALMSSLMPILLLIIKVESIRKKGSKEEIARLALDIGCTFNKFKQNKWELCVYKECWDNLLEE